MSTAISYVQLKYITLSHPQGGCARTSESELHGRGLTINNNYQIETVHVCNEGPGCDDRGYIEAVSAGHHLPAQSCVLCDTSYPAGTALELNYEGTINYISTDGVKKASRVIAIKMDDSILGFSFIGSFPPTGTQLYVMPHDERGDVEEPCDHIMPGLNSETMLETEIGLVKVRDLAVGDRVLTRDNGYQSIRWIGSLKLSSDELMRRPNLRPICIRAGALGRNIPFADLLVSPQQRMLIRSKLAYRMLGTPELLAPAKQLLQVDGVDIAADLPNAMYVFILFDRHEVIISNGAETESLYIEDDTLKALGSAAQKEIPSLLSEYRITFEKKGARMLASGRQSRKLVTRHRQKKIKLVN